MEIVRATETTEQSEIRKTNDRLNKKNARLELTAEEKIKQNEQVRIRIRNSRNVAFKNWEMIAFN